MRIGRNSNLRVSANKGPIEMISLSDLPTINPNKIIPSRNEVEALIADLKDQSEQFANRYRMVPLRFKAHQDLVDATLWFCQIYEKALRVMHIGKFIEAKYLDVMPAVTQQLEAESKTAVQRVWVFYQYLQKLPPESIERLSHEFELQKYAPFIRGFTHAFFREQHHLPVRKREEIIQKLHAHLRDPDLDDPAYQNLLSLSHVWIEGATLGHTSPITYIQKRNFHDETELAALRDAVEQNKSFLRAYLQARQVDVFPDDRSGLSMAHRQGMIGWDLARDIAVRGHAALSPTLGQLAENVFSRGLIEAVPVVPVKNHTVMQSHLFPPTIFMGFRGSLFHGQEVAHEVGHAVSVMLRDGSGEMKSFHSSAIDEALPDLMERIYWKQIDLQSFTGIDAESLALDIVAAAIGGFMIVDGFHNTSFELLDRKQKFKPKYLDCKWSELQKEYFGHIAQQKEMRTWRSMPLASEHNRSIISYVYAQLLAERLWQEYSKGSADFGHKLVEFLKETGTKPPAELAKIFGFDTRDPSFWNEGFRDIREAVHRTSRLAQHNI